MKTLAIAACLALAASSQAQNTAGTIQYEEVVKFEIEVPPEMASMAHLFPTEQKTNTELLFTASESLYRASNKAAAPAANSFESGEAQVETKIAVIGGGASATTWYNLEDQSGLRSDDLMGKQFLVSLNPRKIDWKVANEQRNILGYTCMKAETVLDEREVVAWFTPQIPLPIGPDSYGGLPGAILALEMPREKGKTTVAATSVTLETPAGIEKPTDGKRVSEEKFEEIVEVKMQAPHLL